MQLDTGGAYAALPGMVSSALGTLRYRKIVGLERDDCFAALLRHPLFLEIAAHQYGSHAPISAFRAIVMNKPAGHGTALPWHQDGGDVWALDHDPLMTIWVALDAATTANGCVEVVAGSQRLGLLSKFGSTLSDESAARYCPAERIVPLELEAGHGVLLHNWVLHRSGVNRVQQPRRAFTAVYMDGRTRSTLTGKTFPLLAGSLPEEPVPFVRQIEVDANALREQSRSAVEYATSLRDTNEQLVQSLADATRYAVSLKDANIALDQAMRDAAGYARDLEAQLATAVASAVAAERYAWSLDVCKNGQRSGERLRSAS
jgi:hypothetical protein